MLRETIDLAPQLRGVDVVERELMHVGPAILELGLVHGQRLTHSGANPLETLVVRDRREPGLAVTRLGPAEQRLVGGEERLLRGVLRFELISKQAPTDPLDQGAVLGEQRGAMRAGRLASEAALERLRASRHRPRRHGGRCRRRVAPA